MSLSNEITFQLLKHSELVKFQKFIYSYWDKKHIFTKESSIFNWLHKGDKNYHYMIAKIDDEIIGIHGIIPFKQFDNDLNNNQFFIALWRIIEGKGIGIGVRMFNAIIDEYEPCFIAGLNINANVIPFYERLGFQCYLMDYHVAISPSLKKFKIAKLPRGIEIYGRKQKYKNSFYKLSKDELSALNTNKLYLYQLPIKSDEYIINRYMNHPVYNYEIYGIINNDSLQSLCVIRPIAHLDSIALSLVDYIGKTENFKLLYDFISFLLNKYNAEYIFFYSHGIPNEIIEEAGFINVKDTNNIIFPTLFEPFENRNFNIRCGYKTSSNQAPVRIFKGDGDADRPSQINA